MSRASNRYIERVSALLLLLVICIGGLSVAVDAKKDKIDFGSNALTVKQPKQHVEWRY